MRHRSSILENMKFLMLIGILAGALGGLAIGLVTNRSASPSASAGTAK